MAISRVQAMRPALKDVIDALNQITDIEPYITAAVNAWLEAHPEATTTVVNGSITYIKLATSLIEWLMSEYDKRTLYDSFAPLFTAGSALGIMSADETDASAWLERTSTSDGPNMAKSIHGRTLRWNQLVSDSATSVTVPSGHKYVARIDGTATLATSSGASITVTGGTDNVFDLTAMFGAGSEPTLAEFEAMYPLPYYPYDTGSLLPVNMTGIATEDANGNPLQTRSIPAGTLRGAGSVYDELTTTERITRVGEVDLGTLTWFAAATTGATKKRMRAALAGVKVPSSNSAMADLTCAKYNVTSSTGTYNLNVGIAVSVDGYVFVYDANYTDAAAFKTAMSGVMLHYALATPTTVEIDPPLNMTYRTETGGTERVMVPTGEQSAPPTIVAAHGYAADSLLDTALSTIAPIEGDTASANYAVGSYLMHDNRLCLVVSSIASGEPIVIGQNVTVTTVMAELVRLTQ